MSKKADFKYKNDHNLEERKNESSRILREYQNRLPIICELAPQSQLFSSFRYDNKSIFIYHKKKYRSQSRTSIIFIYFR